MHEAELVVNTVAPIANVRLLVELVEKAKSAQPGLPKMAVFYGQSGLGKSVASIFAANTHDSYSVQMKSTYAAKHFLEKCAEEMGLEPKGTAARLVDRIGEHLARPRGPNREQPSLIIDEADILAKRKAIEVVRDIYESSGAAVILIGEEKFPKALEKWERVHGRMMDWVPAQPVSAADAGHLAKIYCAGVDVSPELFELVLKQSSGSARRISVNFNAIREFAGVRNLTTVGIKEWQDRALSTGLAPSPRRNLFRGAA